MSVQAFILIQTEVGKATGVADAVAKIPGVTFSEGVTGPYDVIMRAEAASMEEFGPSGTWNYTYLDLPSYTPELNTIPTC
jgi:hypothetical protein